MAKNNKQQGAGSFVGWGVPSRQVNYTLTGSQKLLCHVHIRTNISELKYVILVGPNATLTHFWRLLQLAPD